MTPFGAHNIEQVWWNGGWTTVKEGTARFQDGALWCVLLTDNPWEVHETPAVIGLSVLQARFKSKG